MVDKNIWSFKHEPQTLNDYIASPEMKQTLQRIIDEVPNTMLFGRHGTGKGTFMNILLRTTGYDYIKINGSKESSVDVIRDKIETFAMSMGTTRYKIVYYNECDNSRNRAAQEAMLDLMEQVQNITRFFFVGNYLNKMIPELRSRCEIVELHDLPLKDVAVLSMKILKKENITEIDKDVLARIIKKCHPDMRKLINTLKLSVEGNKLVRMRVASYEDKYKNILTDIVDRNIDSIRKIVRTYQIDYNELYEYLFEHLPTHDKAKSPGDIVIEIAEAAYRDSFLIVKEIGLMGMIFKLYKGGLI